MQGFNRYPLAVSVVASVALVGCFGGSSSSSNGTDVISSDLTDEQQAVLAAQELSEFEDQADSLEEDLRNRELEGDTGSSAGFGTASNTQESPCDSGGPITIEDEFAFDGEAVPFPDGVNGAPDGSGEGYRLIADDCTMNFNGDSTNMDGQLEIAEFHDFPNDGTIYLRAGGVSGEQFSDINAATSFDDAATMQGHMMLCYNCVDANPGDRNAEVKVEDSAMIAHMSSEMEDFQLILGDNVPDGDPLSVVTREHEGDSGAWLEANGRHAFSDDSGCAIDITMETVNEIAVDSWGPTVSNPNIVDGEMNITTNESGETYNVEWQSGEMLIDNEPVSDDALEGVAEC